jgi:hypothetical protein
MSEAMPPADDSESFDEAYRRIKELFLWLDLEKKFIYPKQGSVPDLARRLKFWQAVECVELQCPGTLHPSYREVASQIEDGILQACRQACRENDSASMRRLSDALALMPEVRFAT